MSARESDELEEECACTWTTKRMSLLIAGVFVLKYVQ